MMRLITRIVLAASLVAALGVTTVLASPCSPPHQTGQRIVAVGDVHGDFGNLVLILQKSGLIDENLSWSGGSAILVQTGDLVDRGAAVRDVLDLMIRLETESAAAGGEVVCLLGNHELMNLFAVQRDNNPEAYQSFVDFGSKSALRKAWKRQVEVWEERARLEGHVVTGIPPETRQDWHDQYPPGAIEYLQAMAPDGIYGRWLRARPSARMIGGNLFIHAGVTPRLEGWSPARINRRITNEIDRFANLREALIDRDLATPWDSIQTVIAMTQQELERIEDTARNRRRPSDTQDYIDTLQSIADWATWLTLAEDGPTNTRIADEWDSVEDQSRMTTLLEAAGARRMIVGHTPQSGAKIRSSFGDSVFLIDTGMLSASYHGRPSALEICGETISAIYPDSRTILVAPPPSPSESGPHHPEDAPLPDLDSILPMTPVLAPPKPVDAAGAWLDVHGHPLPFQSLAEIEEFLATARVVAQEALPVGVSQPLKLILERNGVRSHAVFKHIDEKLKYVEFEVYGQKRLFPSFRDYHLYDSASYRLAQVLELDRVPPAVPRHIDQQPGTVIMWLEGAISEKERRRQDLQPPNSEHLLKQLQMMQVFDAIAGNIDGNNLGNALIDANWKLWFIDCSRCFVNSPQPLTLTVVKRCERKLWQRLNEISDDELVAALRDLLGRSQLKALLKRKHAVVAYLDKLIAENGEVAVLFDLD